MNRNAWLPLTACLVTGMAQATCYSIYKADGTLLQQSSTSPVNLSLQIGDTVPERFGVGTTMTVSDYDMFCPNASERQHRPKSLADSVLQEENKRAAAKVKNEATSESAMKTAAK